MEGEIGKSGKKKFVDSYFETKAKESKEVGVIKERYTIGADIGFVYDEKGEVVVKIFEVNGKYSGLTQYKDRQTEKKYNPKYSYGKRLFRTIRKEGSDNFALEKIKSDIFCMEYFYYLFSKNINYEKNSDFVDKLLSLNYIRKDSLYFIDQMAKRNNAFISYVHDFLNAYAKVDNRVAFIEFVKQSKTDERVLADEACAKFYEILSVVVDHLLSVTYTPGYDNFDGSEEIFEDKIVQQAVIPEKYRIRTVNGGKFFIPQHKWFMVKKRRSSRGKGVFKMHYLAFAKIYYSSKRKSFLDEFLVQEMVKTVGADNASWPSKDNHSSMRLLLDVSIRESVDGKLFAVVESGDTTHNIYPRNKDMFGHKRSFFTKLPEWAKFEPRKGAEPINSSENEVRLGTEAVKEIALATFRKLHVD